MQTFSLLSISLLGSALATNNPARLHWSPKNCMKQEISELNEKIPFVPCIVIRTDKKHVAHGEYNESDFSCNGRKFTKYCKKEGHHIFSIINQGDDDATVWQHTDGFEKIRNKVCHGKCKKGDHSMPGPVARG